MDYNDKILKELANIDYSNYYDSDDDNNIMDDYLEYCYDSSRKRKKKKLRKRDGYEREY